MRSGHGVRSVEDRREAPFPCVVQTLCGLLIAYYCCPYLKLLDGHAWVETLRRPGQRVQLLLRRHHQRRGIALALTAFGVGDDFGEEAGAGEVELGVEVIAAERLDEACNALRDVAVAQVLAHNAPILRLSLGVIVAVPGARFGVLFDEHLVESLRDVAVDVLRAIVGMKSLDDEGEAVLERFQHRDEECLANSLAGGDPVVRRHAVYGIDRVDALDAVPIALMDAVHA